MSVIVDGSNGLIFNDASTQTTAATGFGFKNRIINGAMVIDQRNAGASISAGDGSYAVDRFLMYHASGSGSKGNIQQNQGSVTPPAGFSSYYGFTTTSAYSVGSGDAYAIQQRIEGLNMADLGWGTANAATVTISFWVRSSLTGTFGGSIVNGGANYSYPFSYTISSANTWEQKSITIVGPTSGTWLTTNGVGAYVSLSIGTGTTYSGTAGSWSGNRYWSATGATSVVGTNGATFYITGVQLEKGSTATAFDNRDYGRELALCQRYLPYWKFDGSSQVFTNSFVMSTTTSGVFSVTSPVPTRVAPTGVTVSSASHFAASEGDSGITFNSLSLHSGSYTGMSLTWGSGTSKTAFRPVVVYNTSSSAYFYGTGCEL